MGDLNSYLTYNMPKEEVLYQLLRKEHGYYRGILEITQMEHEKLNLNRAENEMKPLQKKKKIFLSCIQEIETAMFPLKKHWQGKTDRSDYLSIQIQNELLALNVLLKEILQLDLVNQKKFEQRLVALSEKLKGKTSGIPLHKTGENP